MEKPLIFEVNGFFSLNTQLLIWKLSFTCEANLISFWKKYSLRFLANLQLSEAKVISHAVAAVDKSLNDPIGVKISVWSVGPDKLSIETVG